MRLVDLEREPGLPSPSALALGFFDGVHGGHRRVIQRMVRAARERHLTPAVFTFRNHPRHVLQPGTGPLLLNTFAERVALLAGLGVDMVACCDFTPQLATVSAGDFVTGWLRDRMHAEVLTVGPNYRFGHRAEGGCQQLETAGLFAAVDVVEPLVVAGAIVSSTRVRLAVAEARLRDAAMLLTRSFFVSGTVETGEQVGRQMGAPTANLPVDPQRQYPPHGVYAVWVKVEGGEPWQGVANLGTRPTFGDHEPRLEVHLLDRQQDLYGRDLQVEFVERLRAEKRFADVQALREQIGRDVAQARTCLSRSRAEV